MRPQVQAVEGCFISCSDGIVRAVNSSLCWFSDPWSTEQKRGLDNSWMGLQHHWEAQSYMDNKDSWTSYSGHCYLITLSSSPAWPTPGGDIISAFQDCKQTCYLLFRSYQFYHPRHWTIKAFLLMFVKRDSQCYHGSRWSHEMHRWNCLQKLICALEHFITKNNKSYHEKQYVIRK